ncbi:MAG: hypothetical protein OXH09_18975 [Gammaproteobacteria bacterium]|nr:hypothetical protein [Gammaproteobacteria bacterium]
MDRIDVLGGFAFGAVVLLFALAIGGMFLGFWRGLLVGTVVAVVAVWLVLRFYVNRPFSGRGGKGASKEARSAVGSFRACDRCLPFSTMRS